MPWSDWQFWLVTAIAAWGVWAVVRQVLPARGGDEPGCPSCEVSRTVQMAAEERRQALTDDGEN